jgi:hypothetical protein
MFIVAFGKDFYRGNRLIISVPGRQHGVWEEYNNLWLAKQARAASGDLVFNYDLTIVTDTLWLWDWEIKDPDCYAMRAINKKAVLDDTWEPWNI